MTENGPVSSLATGAAEIKPPRPCSTIATSAPGSSRKQSGGIAEAAAVTGSQKRCSFFQSSSAVGPPNLRRVSSQSAAEPVRK
eukprot:CAMPEP_0180088954 /NCGR_PEP_ID=MMETSP0985-20121206/22533_1 /TAXON_ID=483367 /ORGANISM="non described non described, Strain CCMP 2436" /LENGTH=82 /DNA_ID=CAMNT_0022023443 /DNA_START=958 /DNA_END=1206 /DNA_ORIENTATION=+